MRILHGPTNVGNQPWTLSRAERALGHRSDVVQNYGTWIGYPADKTLSEYAKDTWRARLKRASFSLSAPFRYDVIHYYFGRNFMLWDDFGRMFGRGAKSDEQCLRDVRLAKLLGKRVFMTLQGCDARIASRSNAMNVDTPCGSGRCNSFENCVSQLDKMRVDMIATLLPLMDRVFYLNPELGHFVPKGSFLPYANVDVHAGPIVPPRTSGRPRIVHAPSDGSTKGTPRILAALDVLKQRFDFELILVQGKPHSEAMAIYRTADIAIDQILYGWYGGFAVEMMAMGKPVLCSIRESDKHLAPSAMLADMPICDIRPDHLVDDIAKVLDRQAEWGALSAQSVDYVRKWHDPYLVARYLTEIYQEPSKYKDFGQFVAQER